MRHALLPLRFALLGFSGILLFVLACALLVAATYLCFLGGIVPRGLLWDRREEEQPNTYERLQRAPLAN